MVRRWEVIRENHSGQISLEIIRLCEEINICLVLLPPNTTHLLHPLEVEFFAAMKRDWRQCLLEWKLTNKDVLPKGLFLRMLKDAIETIENASRNLVAGFRIIPQNRQLFVRKIPKWRSSSRSHTLDWSICWSSSRK